MHNSFLTAFSGYIDYDQVASLSATYGSSGNHLILRTLMFHYNKLNNIIQHRSLFMKYRVK